MLGPHMRFPRISPEMMRFGALSAVLVAAGIAITVLLLPPPPDDAPRPPPPLRIAGEVVPPAGEPIAGALDLVRRYASGEITIKLPDGGKRALRRSALGVEIDRARLADIIRETQRPESAIRRAHDREKKPGEPLDLPLPIALSQDIAISKLLDLKAEIDAPATDTFVDLESKKLKPEKIGLRLDVYATLAKLDAALRSGANEVDAAVETIAPKLLAKDLGDVKFDHVLGYFETRYARGEKAKDRRYNLHLAASKLDGAVVMPGQVFDFNGVVGPRDEAHGYRVAPVIAQGELVDGLGGGTCQISGTLHGAAFFAGLEIVERYPHSRPSYYIKLGLDATVVYPTINYRFRNNFDFPIVLHETVSNGVVRAEILGPSRKLTVTYFRRIDDVIPFEEVERKTSKLPEGVRVLAQRGIPGFKTYSSRVIRDGAYAVREHWSDTYPPTTQIVHVGSGPKDVNSKAEDDPHPEYVADEYLTITQGPDIHTPGVPGDEPGGGTVESREAGRSGERGWLERLGMSRYRSNDKDKKDDGDKPDQAEGKRDAPRDKEAKKGKDDEKPRKKRRRKKADSP